MRLRDLALPRPSTGPWPEEVEIPLVVAGMFRTGSGLGRAAQRCYEALTLEGLSPIAVDLSDRFNQADLDPSIPLEPFPFAKAGTIILVANPPELPLALRALGLRRWHNWRIVGAWVWEHPVVPESWKQAEKLVSEIWAPSVFVAEAFRRRFDRPVKIVPHYTPVLAPPSRADGPLRVLTLADARSSLERKNPLAAIRMFRAAFGPETRAELVIKCRNLDQYPDYASEVATAVGNDSRIVLKTETLSDADQARLVQSCDVLLSPHRAEGFGVPLAEAMALGKYVIATGWSGNLEFMDRGNSVLLPYTLVPVIDRTGVYPQVPGAVWAEPNFDAGVAALRAAAAPGGRDSFRDSGPAAIAARLGTRAYVDALRHRRRE